ncbi:MAG TPA: cytochrome c maturation protein CcmE [Polyangiaceae bacterium]
MTIPGPGRAPSRRALRQGRLLLAGGVAFGAVLLTLAAGFFDPKPIYARSVSEFARHPQRETRSRVYGMLVPGSLCKVEGECEFRFRLADTRQPAPGQSELEIRFGECVIPDTFRDVPGFEVELSVEGELCEGCSYFEATQVYAKCPGKYEMTDGGHGIVATPVRSCEPARTR